MSFAGELQSCCQTAKACSDNENIDASAWVCADWCEFHCFVFGDFAEDSTLYIGMRVDSDQTIRGRLRFDPDQAFETHGDGFVKLSRMVGTVQRKEFNGVVGTSDKSEKYRHCKTTA